MRKDENIMRLGEKVAYTRKRKGLSLQQLAQKANVSASYINRIEIGDRQNPSIFYLKRICEALEIPMGEISELGIDREEGAGKLQEIGDYILRGDFEILGKLASTRTKTALVEIIEDIIDSQWTGSEKNFELYELLEKVDSFKNAI